MTVQVVTRLDSVAEAALKRIMAQTGDNRSAIIRRAIIELDRESERERVRRDAARVAADPEDREEAASLAAEMAGYRAW